MGRLGAAQLGAVGLSTILFGFAGALLQPGPMSVLHLTDNQLIGILPVCDINKRSTLCGAAFCWNFLLILTTPKVAAAVARSDYDTVRCARPPTPCLLCILRSVGALAFYPCWLLAAGPSST